MNEIDGLTLTEEEAAAFAGLQQDGLPGEAAEFVRSLRALRQKQAEEFRRKQPWLRLDEVLSAIKGGGKRYPFGLPTLDLRTDGGCPRGKLCVIVGPPGAGKTSLAIQFALHQAKTDSRVSILGVFHDAGMEDAAVCIAQQLGIPRLTAQSGTAGRDASERLGVVDLRMVNVNTRYTMEERVDAWIEDLPADAVPIAIFDSAQAIRSRSAEEQKAQFDKVRVIADSAAQLARQYSMIGYLISQAHRGMYRDAKSAATADPISGGSGAANLEFMPDLHLFLRKKEGRVALFCGKNRLGEEDKFEISLFNDKPAHRHIEKSFSAIVAEVGPEKVGDLVAQVQKVLAVVTANGRPMAAKDIRPLVKMRYAAVLEVLEYAAETGALVKQKVKGRVFFGLPSNETAPLFAGPPVPSKIADVPTSLAPPPSESYRE